MGAQYGRIVKEEAIKDLLPNRQQVAEEMKKRSRLTREEIVKEIIMPEMKQIVPSLHMTVDMWKEKMRKLYYLGMLLVDRLRSIRIGRDLQNDRH